MTCTVSNSGSAILGPDDTPVEGARLKWQLVDSDYEAITRRTIAGVGIIWGFNEVATDDTGVFSIDLWPNALLETSYYIVTLTDPFGIEAFTVQIPDQATITWDDLRAISEPLDPTELSALATHLEDASEAGPNHIPTGGTTGQVPMKQGDGSIGWGTMTGGGDMQTLTYDPTGVADDAFDIANQTGSLDAGTFL